MDSTLLTPRADSNLDAEGNFILYHYDPSLAAAVLFIVLFFLTTLLHAFQLIRSRTWFMIPFCIGGILEIVGYIGRVLASREAPDFTLGPFIVQNIALLVAPAFLAASVYMELARIVLMVGGEKELFIRRERLTKIFVLGDVVSFLMQASGGGLQASKKPTTADAGKYIVIAGLVLQVIYFGLFVLAGVMFHVRLRARPTQKCSSAPWQKHMFSLYFVSICIFVRSIVRVVEFAQGFNGYIITHEVFLYTLDATLMFIAMAAMNWIHPSEVAATIRRYSMAGEKV